MEEKIPAKFLKPYDPQATEDRIYSLWEKSGFFNPDNLSGRPFSIVLPPPNVTGTLHMGHAAMLAIEDIMIRYKRMRGYRTLWIPGTDHAAIATQSKVEKDIEKREGTHRRDLGREQFLKRVESFAAESHNIIVNQIRKMGASIDWSREAFTLDAARTRATRTAFKTMYDLGLIYRGHRIVNWDPKGQTTISDDDIAYKEEKTTFYYLKYGPFVIGTARPETKFGDKYVVVHPDDARYASHAHGQKIELEWINGPITATVIKDPSVDMAFGSGAMTITPWHSVADFEIAEHHKLEREPIIDHFGRLLPIAGEFAGLKISEARAKIVEKLRAKGLIAKEEEYVHNLATAERTGGVIEPQIMEQWFVAVDKTFKLAHSKIPGIASGEETTLKEIMRRAVDSGAITFMPGRFEKIYYHWIDNLRDWCISRQIWYGHRIPVWYRGPQELYVGVEEPSGEGW
ncbi:MAG: valyl-tRNA synthetase, partial [Candidatus Parcubacteria bacterium]|nr:valyl-tRNA synthetase [Candidatus Parcubacteria bacterium]